MGFLIKLLLKPSKKFQNNFTLSSYDIVTALLFNKSKITGGFVYGRSSFTGRN